MPACWQKDARLLKLFDMNFGWVSIGSLPPVSTSCLSAASICRLAIILLALNIHLLTKFMHTWGMVCLDICDAHHTRCLAPYWYISWLHLWKHPPVLVWDSSYCWMASWFLDGWVEQVVSVNCYHQMPEAFWGQAPLPHLPAESKGSIQGGNKQDESEHYLIKTWWTGILHMPIRCIVLHGSINFALDLMKYFQINVKWPCELLTKMASVIDLRKNWCHHQGSSVMTEHGICYECHKGP